MNVVSRAVLRAGGPGIVALFTLLPNSAASDPNLHEFPLGSTGDVWFQADHAGFLEEDRVVQEYYFRVSNNQLRFEPTDDGQWGGRVFVKIQFRDGEQSGVGEASRTFEFRVPTREVAESAEHSQLLLVREPMDVRTREAEITMEDMNARKRGIVYLFTGKRRNGKAKGNIALPPFIDSDFGLSDIQFAWVVEEGDTASSFAKHGLNVIPNPSRSYGLLQARLSAYYEVYDRREPQRPRTYLVEHSFIDSKDNVTPTQPDTVDAMGSWVKVATFDLSRIATGEYRLRARVVDAETGEEAMSTRAFNLLWKNEFWSMSEQDVLDEARVLFTEEEYEKFRMMSAGDRAQYAEQFWAAADPSPGTARNELREEFLRRVAHANLHFSHYKKRGMLTDRGRMYIRFGAPDETVRELMPTQDRQLDQEVRELIQEDATGFLLSTPDEFDTRPYEIWIYTRQGTPLFPERERTTSVTGLRFIFVDETGTGRYILRYASDFIAY